MSVFKIHDPTYKQRLPLFIYALIGGLGSPKWKAFKHLFIECFFSVILFKYLTMKPHGLFSVKINLIS